MEEKKAASFNPLDYNRLKEFGLDYIQKILKLKQVVLKKKQLLQ